MDTAKDYIHKLIDELSEKELPEVLDYIEYIKSKKLKENYQDLQDASQSSMSFWENQIDDEVWNNV
ncbi:DUF2281 domain-containing protein [Fusibacter sp. 3D3]|uniref:DUF2281 domain-containing protein n=1 Tax=Fusibacter sp. 3D3 TaxID=1048380 RepID=UPI000852A401|nr:DUF2281 domain-containing protein [Fusibacter sp. 3D3]GAU78490.1 hypothetical protein F3D3_3124 [Fusibacter sp. 3D3]